MIRQRSGDLLRGCQNGELIKRNMECFIPLRLCVFDSSEYLLRWLESSCNFLITARFQRLVRSRSQCDRLVSSTL